MTKRTKAVRVKTTAWENLSQYVFDCYNGEIEKNRSEMTHISEEIRQNSHYDADYTPQRHIFNASSPNPIKGTNSIRITFEFVNNFNSTDIFVMIESNSKTGLKFSLKVTIKQLKKYAKEFLKRQN